MSVLTRHKVFNLSNQVTVCAVRSSSELPLLISQGCEGAFPPRSKRTPSQLPLGDAGKLLAAGSCSTAGRWECFQKTNFSSFLQKLLLTEIFSSFFFFFFLAVNTYLFMMQAQGIMIRENMRTIGAQVYEQVVRSAYAKRNSSVNDSGISLIKMTIIEVFISGGNQVDLSCSRVINNLYWK